MVSATASSRSEAGARRGRRSKSRASRLSTNCAWMATPLCGCRSGVSNASPRPGALVPISTTRSRKTVRSISPVNTRSAGTEARVALTA